MKTHFQCEYEPKVPKCLKLHTTNIFSIARCLILTLKHLFSFLELSFYACMYMSMQHALQGIGPTGRGNPTYASFNQVCVI